METGPGDGGWERHWLELFARGAGEPVPDSVRLPRLAEPGRAERYSVDYQLIGFSPGREPWMLVCTEASEPGQAAEYADWLNAIEAGRLAVIRPVLSAAGAPAAAGQDPQDWLADLGTWVQEWFAVIAEPLLRIGFIGDGSIYRIGRAGAATRPVLPAHSAAGTALLYSLAHDLAFLTRC